MPKSDSSLRSHRASLVAAAAVMYSASHVEVATVGCSLLHQLMTPSPSLKVLWSEVEMQQNEANVSKRLTRERTDQRHWPKT